MSDTPETDAALIGGGHLYVSACDPHIKASLARKLERERDELRARLSEEQQLHSQTLDERDEARELFESSKRARASLSEACDHLQRERDRMQALAEDNGKLAHSSACEAMGYRRERDEARKTLEETQQGLCDWEQTEDGQWLTDCGNVFEFTDGSPIHNNFICCPYCRKNLTETPYDDDGDYTP